MKQGAYRVAENFPHLECLQAVCERSRTEKWDNTNPDYKYLDNRWKAVHFYDGGRPTEFMDRYPEMRAIVDWFKCDIDKMMFYCATPGTRVHPHRDLAGNLPLGKLRFHIPVFTNPGVEFEVSGAKIRMAEGELWALDTSHVHALRNLGETDRIHLVVQVHMNEWCWALIPQRTFGYYAHCLRFFVAAGWMRSKNILRRPELFGHSLRQVRAMGAKLVGKRQRYF